MIFTDIKNGRFYNEDCFDAMREIPDGVIDMVLCDLPYGTTDCKWDTIIPFDKLWAEYWRITKENAAIVLTASQPFTTALISSQINNFRYSLVWEKERPSNPLLANKQIMKYHEDICIFYRSQCIYNPQLRKREEKNKRKNAPRQFKSAVLGENSQEYLDMNQSGENDWIKPTSIIKIPMERGLHPTQKPVALFEYLIKTYTNEAELVLDNTAGSGTTAIAAINTNRKWVCIEKDETYYGKAIERISGHVVTA